MGERKSRLYSEPLMAFMISTPYPITNMHACHCVIYYTSYFLTVSAKRRGLMYTDSKALDVWLWL